MTVSNSGQSSSRYSAEEIEEAYAQIAKSYRGTHDPNFPMGYVNVLHTAARYAVSEQQRSQFIPAFKFWYERDGSVGGLSQVVEEHADELKQYER